jgi:Fe2+ or Zn2+ uptake regulation protein
MAVHSHFSCDRCGRIYDLELAGQALSPCLPKGFHLDRSDISLRGVCAHCATEPALCPSSRA